MTEPSKRWQSSETFQPPMGTDGPSVQKRLAAHVARQARRWSNATVFGPAGVTTVGAPWAREEQRRILLRSAMRNFRLRPGLRDYGRQDGGQGEHKNGEADGRQLEVS